ncbi:DUF1264 domain protein [Moelleriella libera RCEF 2490]|uniref:DUF1264 domain protein n=1 Tax=Moelleriella libera RCEF 2490 TaxID=1081109 RepID=A0A168F9I0_9HYPO|nr:DUF1264 domain protein [Moelleriella libera RCEF 2490]
MASSPAEHNVCGAPLSRENAVLAGGASITQVSKQASKQARRARGKKLVLSEGQHQDFGPVKNVCAHLNAFHAYADDPERAVETNHYCSHLNDEVRQCLLYDSDDRHARLIGIEYMITPRLYESLQPDERRLWHSHVYEVKSGMLVMPNRAVPQSLWELAEKREMEQVITLYGKTYHLWQTDRGDQLPLGEPKLMTSYTADGQMDFSKVEARDERFGTDFSHKKEDRVDIPVPLIHKVV